MSERRLTYRNDIGRGRETALTAAADALDETPDRVSTHSEIGAWLRARVRDSDLTAPTSANVPNERALAGYAARLAELRDETLAGHVSDYSAGQASAYRLALDALYVWTQGRYGASMAGIEYPCPGVSL